ncbi:MAG: IPT/TIG domain-containing protein [Kofleriaceae bacterium]
MSTSLFRGLLLLGLAGSVASAQPTIRDHRDPKTVRPEPRPKGPPRDPPREAPPPPRVEAQAARKGFVWVTGHWDWKRGKWEWLAGHWERERAGKQWRESRWDRKDDIYVFVNGEWVDAGSGPIVPPDRFPPDRAGDGRPGDGRPGDRPRRRWRLENPVVSSYWPAKGKPGTRVVIRGRNFVQGTEVVFAGGPIPVLKVGPNEIVFAVPANAQPRQAIGLRWNNRNLVVGAFETVDAYDPVAEARRLDEERRKAAEAWWAAREKQINADRAARETEWRRRHEEMERTRDERRISRARAIRAKWDRAFLIDPATQDELTLHAQRVAELGRMREVAELANNGKLAIRVEIAESRENERHDQRMEALKTTFEVK